MPLYEKKCVPCEGGIPPLKGEEIEKYKKELHPEWEVEEEHHLKRIFRFKNFQEALEFVNKVGKIAEEENHHPNICFTWGWVEIKIYTHKINGLHENDFILASKIDRIT